MSDLVQKLRAANTWLNEGDCCGQLDASGTCMAPACIFGEALKMANEAARTIEILRVELAKVNMENDRLTRTNRAKREHRDKLLAAKAKDAARIEQLEAALRFYAEGNWSDGYPGGVKVDDNTLDFGETARAALEDRT